MNQKQKLILRKLVEVNGQKYSELYRHFVYEDKFPYHLKYLVLQGLVSKREGKYYLTKEGMKETSRFDSRTLVDVEAPITGLLFICKFGDLYLISEHFGEDSNKTRRIFALPSSKPLWGVSLEESCKREFFRKNKVTADFQYRSTFHLVNYTTDGDVLFDNIFLVFEAEIDEEEFTKCKKKYWLTSSEIAELPNIAITVKKLILENDRSPYMQSSVVLNYGVEEEDL